MVGSTQGGSLIAPETVRRLACDANVIPTVLGSRGEVLDLGRSTRLATPGQLAALWLRDRGCSFPGCTTPAHWCDAHHLVHWADGGTSGLTNLALLCGRHHSVVHRDHLIGHITGASAVTGAVTWNVIPGSYDRRHHAIPPPGDPRPGGQPPCDQPPGDSPPPLNRPAPDQHEWDNPAPDADPWADLWQPSGRSSTGEPEVPDANPEANPWHDSGPAA